MKNPITNQFCKKKHKQEKTKPLTRFMLNIYTSIHVYLMMPLPCFMSSLDPFFRWLLTNNSTLKKCRIRTNIRPRIQKIKKNTKHCHQRKMERDNVCIENNNNNNKRNRHFSRKHETEKKKEKKENE